MTTAQQRITDLAAAIGVDIKNLQGQIADFFDNLGETAATWRSKLGISNHEKLTVGNDGGLRVTAPFGYASGVGVGSAIAQTNSKSEPVGLNAPTGSILLHGQTLAAGASASFVFYNASIGANDLLLISRYIDNLNDVFSVEVTFVTTGGAGIRVKNISGTAQGGQPQIKYAVIKGAAS